MTKLCKKLAAQRKKLERDLDKAAKKMNQIQDKLTAVKNKQSQNNCL
jgi:prefoldin subunit 5